MFRLRGLDLLGATDWGKVIKTGTGAAGDIGTELVKPDAAAPSTDAKKPDAKQKIEEVSFFDTLIVGPVKVWHALLGVGATVGAALLLRGKK